MQPFIDANEIDAIIEHTVSTPEAVRAVIAKSLSKKRLSLRETAILINTNDPVLVAEIKEGAKELKKRIYGNRIVLFAPLYIGNKCSNNCTYCGFRASNADAKRVTLTDDEIVHEIESLEDHGQKRLILVYGEHRHACPDGNQHFLHRRAHRHRRHAQCVQQQQSGRRFGRQLGDAERRHLAEHWHL